MCHIGSYHDFHGIGVANLIFGLLCIILPDHGKNHGATSIHGKLKWTKSNFFAPSAGFISDCCLRSSWLKKVKAQSTLRKRLIDENFFGLKSWCFWFHITSSCFLVRFEKKLASAKLQYVVVYQDYVRQQFYSTKKLPYRSWPVFLFTFSKTSLFSRKTERIVDTITK